VNSLPESARQNT